MTSSEMRTILVRKGVAEETIARVTENFDIEKISMIIDAATNPESAFEAIHTFYPELEVEKMQEQMNFLQSRGFSGRTSMLWNRTFLMRLLVGNS